MTSGDIPHASPEADLHDSNRMNIVNRSVTAAGEENSVDGTLVVVWSRMVLLDEGFWVRFGSLGLPWLSLGFFRHSLLRLPPGSQRVPWGSPVGGGPPWGIMHMALHRTCYELYKVHLILIFFFKDTILCVNVTQHVHRTFFQWKVFKHFTPFHLCVCDISFLIFHMILNGNKTWWP